MPFISEEDFESRRAKTAVVPSSQMIIRPTREPALERKNLTDDEKVILGTFAQIDGPSAVSEITGISIPTIRKCAEGMDRYEKGQDPNKPSLNPDLKAKVDKAADSMRERLQSLAHSKIEKTLDKITDEKLESVTKASDLANIASSLSKVAASFDKHDGPSVVAPIQFNVFRPRMKEEEEYEIIEVNE